MADDSEWIVSLGTTQAADYMLGSCAQGRVSFFRLFVSQVDQLHGCPTIAAAVGVLIEFVLQAGLNVFGTVTETG
jgi:hypothetical protein